MLKNWQFPFNLRSSRTVVVATACASLVILYQIYKTDTDMKYFDETKVIDYWTHNLMVDQFYENRKSWSLSALGNVLYKNEAYPEISEEKKNKTFVIMFYKHWDYLKRRYLYEYGKEEKDPLRDCSVKNCVFTGDNSTLGTADAVVVHLHRGDIPPEDRRHPYQRWIFLSDESPLHTFGIANHAVPLKSIQNIFNWSMTYRKESDVPVPYGRTKILKTPIYTFPNPPIENLIPNWKNKTRDVLVGLMISNCRIKYRNELIQEIREHIKVDVHGSCGDEELKKSCPGHFRADCDKMSQYLFYLAFENSKCEEYMTEKLFHNAYSRGAIPIIQGAPLEDCITLLPPNSYIHVDNYNSVSELVEHVKRISENEKELLFYHDWRNYYEILQEHGFFGKRVYHLCRICEAMNYNDDSESVYNLTRLYPFLAGNLLCRK